VMRPPMPAVNLSRQAKIALTVVAALVVFLILAASLVNVYVDYLWFHSVHFGGVYSTMLRTRVLLFFGCGLLMAGVLAGNVWLAYRLRPPFRPVSPEQQNLERYRIALEPRKKLLLIALAVVTFFAAGSSGQRNWKVWLLWIDGGKFGVKDPQFHLDISFFAWDYPLYRVVLGFLFAAIIFSILLSAATYYLYGALRLQTPGAKITISARRHLTMLVFFFIVFKAAAYWLDRYGLVYSGRGKVTGASYTDVNASLPAKTILFWVAIVIAIGVLASMWMSSPAIPAISFVVLVIMSIVISGIYPALVQQITVKPNASTKEAKYISRNIEATQTAYGIKTGSNVTYQNYEVTKSPPTSALAPTDPTVSDIRILDPNVVSPTFTQQQRIENVYGFATKLDVDRYTIKNAAGQSETNDYIVGVRELKATNLAGTQSNWINQHTVYTHGYGFVAAQANDDVTSDGAYAEGNIPPTGPLNLSQPDEYYGELLPAYSVVGASGTPQEFDGSDAPKVTYKGGGGVSLGNIVHRLAFAVKYSQTNFLLNSAVGAKGAKLIYNRDPRQIVSKVAPFLKIDSDPYPIVDSSTGHMVWIVDGYTTMSQYPYSERESLSDLTKDSLSTTGRTATLPDDEINYIRNSVKATVDAYTGKVTLYDWDTTDPVLKAWMRIFPNLVSPQSAMPASIMSHVRYPEDLFKIQRALIGSYHVTNAITFYNVGNKWTVPVDPNDPNANQPPYYVLASQPNSGVTAPKFQLTTPMLVNNSQNLAAYISVNSDPGPAYGKMTVLTVPGGIQTNGPEQVSNILTSNSVITKDLSLFNSPGGGSSVVHGNLLTLPIGKSFLYVEPLYVQGSSGNASYPVLTRVLAVYGDKVGYAPTLSDALTNLSQTQVGLNIPGSGNTGAVTPTTPPSSTPPSGSSTPSTTSTGPPTTAAALLVQVNAAFKQLAAAYKSGDPVAVGTAEALLQKLTAEYLALPGTTPTSVGASKTPTATASPTK
jgi:uncharacterized membrane protein (UPF0182 family)